MLAKGKKNEVEIQGMIASNVRDAVAVIDMAAELEEEIEAGSEEWDELRVSKELSAKRKEQGWDSPMLGFFLGFSVFQFGKLIIGIGCFKARMKIKGTKVI
jgi:hypothetical protein